MRSLNIFFLGERGGRHIPQSGSGRNLVGQSENNRGVPRQKKNDLEKPQIWSVAL